MKKVIAFKQKRKAPVLRNLLLTAVTIILLSSCGNDFKQNKNNYLSEDKSITEAFSTSSENITEISEITSSKIEEDAEMTNAIPTRQIYINGDIHFIESISPSDDIVFIDDKYISIYSGESSKFAHLLSKDEYVGSIIIVDGVPQAELESNFYTQADVYTDGNETIIVSESDPVYMESIYNYSDEYIAEKVKPDYYNAKNVFSIYPVIE